MTEFLRLLHAGIMVHLNVNSGIHFTRLGRPNFKRSLDNNAKKEIRSEEESESQQKEVSPFEARLGIINDFFEV